MQNVHAAPQPGSQPAPHFARLAAGVSSAGAPAPVIIIGAGPTGLRAAIEAAALGMRPVIIDALPEIGGQPAALYPDRPVEGAEAFGSITRSITGPVAGSVSGRDLTRRLGAALAPYGPLLLTGRRAMSVWGDLDGGFNVETDTGETITGAGVIFAGGAGALRQRRLEAKGVEELSAATLGYAPGGAPAAGRIAIVGAGPAAVKAALDLTDGGAAVTLIHEAPLSAAPERLAALDAAAAKAASPDNDADSDADNAGRLTILAGTLEAVEAPEGRLLTLHVAGTGGHTRVGADYILVQAGLELIDGALTGMEPVIDLSTGETANPGLFVLGDAASGGGQLAEASFADGARAASALSRRLSAPLAPGFRLGAA